MGALTAKSAVILIASVIAGLTLPAPALGALAAPGQITRADASPDWTHGSIAGLVRDVPDADYRVTRAWASILPNSGVCEQFVAYPIGGAGLIWESAGAQPWSFDIPNLPLNSGITPRLCLYGYLENIYYPTGRDFLLATRIFTVPPAPVTPRPPAMPQPKTTPVRLSRTTAHVRAKSALKARFGRAYRRGKWKRLSCDKQSSTRYRCTFSFRYRKTLRRGIVAVAIKPDGSISARVKPRDAHAASVGSQLGE